MKKRNFPIILVVLLASSYLLFNACKKDETASGTDLELYNMAIEPDGFIWYKNSDELLNRSVASGHNFPLLRTRYNEIAARSLDANGKIKPQTIFSDSSLIVKELWNNESSLGRYAILFKNSKHPNADDKGWVWGYIDTDKTVKEPASNKGTMCISCHLQEDNVDYMLMNKFFP